MLTDDPDVKAALARKRKPDPLVVKERERQVVKLTLAGASTGDIARALSLAESTVRRIRKQALEARAREATPADVDELRALELARLDELQAAHWTAARAGNTRSARVVLNCIDRRCKLLGLDAPIQIAGTLVSELDAEIESLLTEMRQSGALQLGADDVRA